MSGPLPHLDAAAIAELVPFGDAVSALRDAFSQRVLQPERTSFAAAGGDLLVMPAALGAVAGVKTVMVQPANAARGEPTIQGTYLLLDAAAGRPVATLDGLALTALRTPAASALVTRALARADSLTCTIVGTGPQGRAHVDAMRWALPGLQDVQLVGRGDAIPMADVICTCTSSPVPLFDGALVRDGTHINAVGTYRAERRELDAALMRRSMIVVDDHRAARAEAGEIVMAAAWDQVAGDLHDVVTGNVRRADPSQITVFKSVGLALEDLAVAQLAAQRAGLL
jgi:ornithine cyclodeaminase/alanine dehydrogenase-like protein (mu-crystallin family)